MEIFFRLAETLQYVLTTKPNELAKEGFIKRQRKITGSNFVSTLIFGWIQYFTPSVEGLARAGYTHGLTISAQGLDKRFTQEACEFMKSVTETAIAQIVTTSVQVNADIFNPFPAIYLADCSTVALPTELETIWQGVGGSENASKAALKIDTNLEIKTGQMHFNLLPGRHSDSRSPVAESVYEKGSLRIQDLGYFNLGRMKQQAARGEYWISRLQPGTQVFSMGGTPINLNSHCLNLLKQGQMRNEIAVKVGVKEQLTVRMLFWKLPEEEAGRRRAKMLNNGRKHSRMPSEANLAGCDWNILITNVEPEKLNHEDCFVMYGVRWQIELIFKLWKSHSGLGHSRSEKPERILCEIYAKLLAIIVQHWIVLTGLWRKPDRSLVKGHQMIKEQSSGLAKCIDDLEALANFLKELADRFNHGCSMNKRKKKLNTCQRIELRRAYA